MQRRTVIVQARLASIIVQGQLKKKRNAEEADLKPQRRARKLIVDEETHAAPKAKSQLFTITFRDIGDQSELTAALPLTLCPAHASPFKRVSQFFDFESQAKNFDQLNAEIKSLDKRKYAVVLELYNGGSEKDIIITAAFALDHE
jgi:hypothetical protein